VLVADLQGGGELGGPPAAHIGMVDDDLPLGLGQMHVASLEEGRHAPVVETLGEPLVQGTPLVFGEAAPDALLEDVLQGEVEALAAYRAPAAQLLRLRYVLVVPGAGEEHGVGVLDIHAVARPADVPAGVCDAAQAGGRRIVGGDVAQGVLRCAAASAGWGRCPADAASGAGRGARA